MTEEKKVTEVIQEIKNEVDEILSYIKNMDFKYTLILDRLNRLIEKETSGKLPTVEASEIVFPEYQPVLASQPSPNLKSKLQLALEQAQKDQDEEDQIGLATQQDGKRRTLRQHAENQNRQIPTQQRIIYKDGKAIYMANVEVFDANQKLVKQVKTNQAGKWLAPLAPGEYQIKISKGANALKQKVEVSYMVTIPNQDSTVDLGTKVVES